MEKEKGTIAVVVSEFNDFQVSLGYRSGDGGVVCGCALIWTNEKVVAIAVGNAMVILTVLAHIHIQR